MQQRAPLTEGHFMARAPFQVLVYPYRKLEHGTYEFALLRRADAGFWQGIAGGGEDGESALDAARRETWEEAGLPVESSFLRLDTVEPAPVIEFRDSYLWGEERFVIPQYCFGVLVEHRELALSPEHTEYRWLAYEAARDLLKYDGNKTALWELHQRLQGRGPRG
jgi:dATP pyrophosphohydrolase